MKRRSLRKSLMVVVMTLVVIMGGLVVLPEKASAANSKTLSINWDNIKKVGKQTAYSVSCGCFAAAYSKTIVDNKVHYWYEFDSVGKKDQFNCSSNWKGCTSKEASSVSEIYKIAYDSINNNKPVIVRVQGNLSSGHYVTIVGYKNVESRDKLSASNFIMIDSVSNKYQTYTLNTNYGWKGSSYNFGYKVISKANGKYQYVIPNGGNVPAQSTITNSKITKIPSTITQGNAWTCDGTVSSNYNIKYVNGYIITNTGKKDKWNDETKVYSSFNSNIGAKTYNLKNSKTDRELLFDKLSPGNYYYIITARDTTDAPLQVVQNFTVVEKKPTNNQPVGVVDSVVCDTSGKIHVQGWAYDPDSKATALDIHVYVGGPAGQGGVYSGKTTANLERTDVNKVYNCGNYHGYNAEISTSKIGNVAVYIYAIDTAGGNNPLLGNKTVNVATAAPIGVFEKVESVSANKIHVVGWAYDPDTKDKAVTVAVYIGGQCNVAGVESHQITADITREDINKSKNCGTKHGFDAVITTQKTGVQAIYVWVHNTDGSPSNINTFLGNKEVNIHNCNAVIDPAVAPTYEATGLTEGSHCSVCGKVIVAQEVVPKLLDESFNNDQENNNYYDEKDKNDYSEWADNEKDKLIYNDEDNIDKEKQFIDEKNYTDIEKQKLVDESATTDKEVISPINVPDNNSSIDKQVSKENDNNIETGSKGSTDSKPSTTKTVSNEQLNNDTSNDDESDDEFVIGNVSYEIISGNRVMVTSVDENEVQSLNIPDTVNYNKTKYKVVCIYDEAFKNCNSLKKIVIGKNVEEIGDSAFKNCSNLKSITINTTKLTKKSIGKNAFKGISKKAAFKCPKKQFKNYKKWIKKAGAPKTTKYKK